jgi:hypothetical protein
MVIVCNLIYFQIFRKYEYIFSSWSKQIVWNRRSPFMGEAVWTNVCSTNISCFGTTYDVTSGKDSNLDGAQVSKI